MNKRIYIIIGVVLSVFVLIVLILVSLTGMLKKKVLPQTPQEVTAFSSPELSVDAMKEIDESHRLYAPDIYILSKIPVVQSSFNLDTYFDSGRRKHVFTVYPKVSSLQQVQEDVNNWLLSIGLTDEQINTLIIEYTQEVN